MGAIAGASYAAGKLDYLEDMARNVNFRNMLRFMEGRRMPPRRNMQVRPA